MYSHLRETQKLLSSKVLIYPKGNHDKKVRAALMDTWGRGEGEGGWGQT